MVLGVKSNKRTKSHSVKKSEIFLLQFFSEKEKTCENTVFTQALELIVGLEPTTCALRMRCSTN